MKHIKLFEKFKEKIYLLILRENGNLEELEFLSKNLFDILNDYNITFRTYFLTDNPSPGLSPELSIIFTFDHDISSEFNFKLYLNEKEFPFYCLQVHKDIIDSIFKNEITDIELFFNYRKYNL